MTPGFYVGDSLDLLAQMPDQSVHCVVTSPPYYALRSYLPEGHPDKAKEIGSEPTLDAFLQTMVAVFRAVHRVLRDDGTLWLNLGDAYAGGAQGGLRNENWAPVPIPGKGPGSRRENRPQMDSAKAANLPPKNLLMVPARVALALQADGWILRADNIWNKPNPMPESCRDRPTSAHEHVFLFAKRPRYFYDGDAVREGYAESSLQRYEHPFVAVCADHPHGSSRDGGDIAPNPAGRNLRNVWTIPTQAVRYKHYATFPEKLVEPCIKAGTSQEGVCVECGAPWERVVEVERDGKCCSTPQIDHLAVTGPIGGGLENRRLGPEVVDTRTTTGWRPTCGCDAGKKPALVLDPFMGSGTVARVCERLGREWIGIDLDERNRDMCELRLARVQKELLL